MRIKLVNGVYLTIIPTTKYTTTKIMVNFATKQTLTNSAVRNVLVNLLVNASQSYPNQTAMARQLAKMYGAELDGYVTRMGTTHNVRISLSCVNQTITPAMKISEALKFMRELIFNPLVSQGQLSPESWQLQRNNLAATLTSWEDDKQYLAAKRLLELYFVNGSAMRIPSTGSAELITNVTSEQLMVAYRQMITHDQVDIIIEGNVSPDEITQQLQNWPFKARPSLEQKIFYQQQSSANVRTCHEHDDIQQAKLNLAYSVPIYYLDRAYYPAIVMNGLFGAGPYSLLFKNVREKASLAYYASSGYRPFAGYLFVQSGIDGKDHQRTQSLITQQLQTIQDGQINNHDLEQVRKNIVNGYLTAQDSPNHLIGQALVSSLAGMTLPTNPVEQIQSVSRQQVSEAAQQLNLQAIYYLDRG
ncbi:EF-P 5-aminopentanol modification-associated protein YfmF [uncultured Limosilactobacillus sp.]|uniref:EF-P 5-aminopentanol modification-associated protein YfmF n=1 Tax=uncultured Limosilactobacillus sp. TaxID=2837629 RepID=UPI0025D65AE1|nr:pitrilysin family protein [uncultured Limosilactobacillus sp.]